MTSNVFESPTLPVAELDPDPDLRSHSKLRRYEIRKRLGQGGGGEVFEAWDPRIGRCVAIKRLGRASGRATAFLREALALARICHPNVVQIFDAEVLDGQAYLVLELVEGPTLAQWSQQGRSWLEIVQMYRDAARGLAAMHRANLVHLDFKPSNVGVTSDGRVKLLDFGLARALEDTDTTQPAVLLAGTGDDDASTQRTRRSGAAGTLAYMSPEQHAAGPVDARADVYAFCVSLYEALVGKLPFTSTDPHGLVQAKRTSAIDVSELPSPIAALVRRGLDPEAERRPSSGGALVNALDRVLTRRRRRWTGFAIGLGALGVSMLSWQLGQDDRRGFCAQRAQDAPAGWSSRARADIASAFARAGTPYAERIAPDVLDDLERYAAAWVSARVKSCEATEVRAEQSPELMQRRDACLDEAQRDFAVRVETLRHADADTVEQAVDLADALFPLVRCENVAVLLQHRVTSSADAQRERLALARVRGELGDVDELVRLVNEVIGHAEARGDDLLRSEALLVRGRGASSRDPEIAGADLRLALVAALQLEQSRVALEASLELARLAAGARRPTEALAFTEVAQGLADALGDDDAHAKIALVRAHAAFLAEDPEAAERHAERAIATITELHGEGIRVALALEQLAEILQASEKPREAQAALERSLAIRHAVLGPTHPGVARGYERLGALQARLGRRGAARDALSRALEIHQANHPADDVRVLAARIERLSTVDDHASPAAERAAWTERLQETTAVLGDEHPLTLRIHQELGSSHARAGETAGAVEHWEAALRISRSTLGEKHPGVADAELKLGRLLREAGSLDDAEPVLGRAVQTFAVHHGPNHVRTLEARNELALLFAQAGDRRRARALDEITARADAEDESARAQVALARARLGWNER